MPREHDGSSVIDAYNAANPLPNTLERYGYKRIGRRYLSPHSTTKLPGVVMFDTGNTCWIHHASDPLCSESSGHPVNAFDLFTEYDHSGDVSAAVKSAARTLGMHSNPRKPPARPAETVDQQPAIAGGIVAPAFDLLPDCNDKGKPLQTIENIAEICRRLSVSIRYNVISKEEEIIIPGASFSFDNASAAAYAWVLSWCARFKMPTAALGEFITYLADQNQYNPVAEWITSAPWDGVSRISDLCDTITTDGDDTLKQTMIRRWLVSAVAAAFEPAGVSAHGVLVIQGEQYVGKTAWFKSLVPERLGLTQDGMTLRPDDRDSVKQAVSFWLVELGELDATFRKADIAALKAFLTRKSDVLRRAYARKESHYARRTVFFASVNQREYLSDPTGNRRYWTISATAINANHGIDMQQLWAEVYSLYQAGEQWQLTRDEVATLNGHNSEYTHVDPTEQRIQTRLEWDDPVTLWEWRTVTEVLLEVGIDRPGRIEASAAGMVLSRYGCQRRTVKGKAQVRAPRVKTV